MVCQCVTSYKHHESNITKGTIGFDHVFVMFYSGFSLSILSFEPLVFTHFGRVNVGFDLVSLFHTLRSSNPVGPPFFPVFPRKPCGFDFLSSPIREFLDSQKDCERASLGSTS